MTHRYTTQVASDVGREGLGIELLDQTGQVVAEVFRSDREGTAVVNTFSYDLPLQAIEALIAQAKERLDPFENGTPLGEARLVAPKIVASGA